MRLDPKDCGIALASSYRLSPKPVSRILASLTDHSQILAAIESFATLMMVFGRLQKHSYAEIHSMMSQAVYS